MTERAQVPAAIVTELGSVCLAMPEAYEEEAWVGIRWRVRGRTFAHVLMVDDGWPPAYARAAATGGPACVLTFRSSGSELAVLRGSDHPFFPPPWGQDVVGLLLGTDIDWDEVAELVTESFCLLAPRRLRELVERPAG